MAYDRSDTRDRSRDPNARWSDPGRDRWSDDRTGASGHAGGNERGFFERAGDEIASWFGDEDAEHRRDRDGRMDERGDRSDGNRERESRMQREQDRSGWFGEGSRDRETSHRGDAYANPDRPRWHSSERDYNPSWRRELGSGGARGADRQRERERDYRPMTGDYGRGEPESAGFFAASGYGRGPDAGRGPAERGQRHDPHYAEWRSRHMDELDRDYDSYRREHQSKFDSDFGDWRERRQSKRQMLGSIREHMEVVGSDQQHVGTVDKAAGDRIILTKSDPEAGGVHHSLSCGEIDRVEGDRVILECSAEQAKERWRDESRGRALFEREDQGEIGPHVLDRSFEGTYR